MKQSKDPFEVAFEEQEAESPPDSPIAPPFPLPPPADGVGIMETLTHQSQTQYSQSQSSSAAAAAQAQLLAIDTINNNTQQQQQQQQEDEDDVDYDDDEIVVDENPNTRPNTTTATTTTKPSPSPSSKPRAAAAPGKSKEDEEDEDEENMDVELGKFSSSADPDKMAKMQSILSHFTEEQMSRYESFRRSGFQKANMKRLLASITGSAKISIPMTIVVSGIAKMFVGELVETARIVMTERKESGPIRPCHIREAYRRLKLEGKIPKKSVPRLFR